MAKVLVVYESKYGNTRLAAEEIAAGIKEASKKAEVVLSEVKKVNFDDVISAGGILIGSPNRFGGATGNIRKFIDKLGDINLNRVPAAVFDTYIAKDFEKACEEDESLGELAIATMRAEKPNEYARMVASIIPKEIDANVKGDLSPEARKWLGLE